MTTAKLVAAMAVCVGAGALWGGGPAQNAARVREIAAMLPEEPGFPSVRADARDFWSLAPASVVANGTALLARPRLVNDESRYTNVVFLASKVSNELATLVHAECAEAKGRFLPRIVETIEDLCAARTWMNPYHDRPNFGNFYGKYRSIDLNAGEVSMKVAFALDRLKGRLPPATVARAMDRLRVFIVEPYLRSARKGDFSHQSWFFGHSNWNAACHWQSVALALSVLPDKTERAEFIEAAERAMPFFLGGFSKEGYCQEGLDYWNYGFGEFLRLTHVVYNATGGKVDFSKLPKAKACYLYPFGFELADRCSPQFNDGTASVPSGWVLYMGEFFWPRARSDFANGMNAFSLGPVVAPVVGVRRESWRKRPPASPIRLPLRTFFEDAQVFIARPPVPGAFTLSACIKGGRNDVPHNHNDAGQFVIALGSTQMVQDPAGKVYDLDTFTSKRYNHPMLNSYGHAVPYPAHTLQAAGARSAKVLRTDFTKERDEIVLDLRPTYTNDCILELTRSLAYVRGKGRQSATISDSVAFSHPETYECPIITYGRVERRGDAAFTIVRPSNCGEKRLDFTVDTAGAKWHVKEEKIPNPKRTEPTRWAVVLDEPATKCSVTLRFAPGDNPPDLSWTVGLESWNPEKELLMTNYFRSANQDLKVEKVGPDAWRFSCRRLITYQRSMAVDLVLDAERKGGKTLVRGSVKNREGGTMFSFDGPYAISSKDASGRAKSGFNQRFSVHCGETANLAPVEISDCDGD